MATDDRGNDGKTREHVEQAFLELLARKGIKPGPDGKLDFGEAKREDVEGMLPELVSTTFGALFESVAAEATEALSSPPAAPQADAATDPGDDDGPIDLAAERAKRQGGRVTTAAEEELAHNLRGAVTKVVARAAEKDGNVQVDADFVKDHGGELMGALFGAIAQSFMPKGATSFKVTVPDGPVDEVEGKKKKPARTKQVDVNLDLGSLFGGLIEQAVRQTRAQSAAAAAEPPSGDDADDDTDDDTDD